MYDDVVSNDDCDKNHDEFDDYDHDDDHDDSSGGNNDENNGTIFQRTGQDKSGACNEACIG